MGWVKVDDGFYDHPKFLNLSLAEIGLRSAALAYANRHLTDGRIPSGWVKRMGGARQASALVDAGLWLRDDEGYVIHDYLDWQRSADQVRELSAKRAAAGKRGGAKRAANAKQVACSEPSKVQPEEEEEQEEEQNPPVGPPSEAPAAPEKRGTRIPEPFTVTADMRDWVERECAGLDWRRETEQFVDYWRAATGQKATKRDWPATWRTWMRRAAAAHTHQPRPVGNEPPRLPVYEPREVPDALPRNELAERARTLRVVRR